MTTAPVRADQSPPPTPPESVDDEQAWRFCWQSLVQVSRTFSRPIEMLPVELRAATTCGYLLCRIADTIEDHPHFQAAERDDLYAAFLAVLERGAPPQRFEDMARAVDASGAEWELARNLDKVMRVFGDLPEQMQQACTPWISEMVRGMSLYGHRRRDENGLVVLETLADLERYCYFVAGTIGQLLTGLFQAAMPELSDERAARMRGLAEDFGLGLQMVNILKDQTDDFERGWCFIPRTLWQAQDLAPRPALAQTRSDAAHDVVGPVFEVARQKLDRALEYTLAVPPAHTGIRLFCLLPLWMAARTLVLARDNDAMFTPDAPVKISRTEVGELIGAASQKVGDDAALRQQYQRLWAI